MLLVDLIGLVEYALPVIICLLYFGRARAFILAWCLTVIVQRSFSFPFFEFLGFKVPPIGAITLHLSLVSLHPSMLSWLEMLLPTLRSVNDYRRTVGWALVVLVVHDPLHFGTNLAFFLVPRLQSWCRATWWIERTRESTMARRNISSLALRYTHASLQRSVSDLIHTQDHVAQWASP